MCRSPADLREEGAGEIAKLAQMLDDVMQKTLVRAEVADRSQQQPPPARPPRSKRGLTVNETSQVCFRLTKEKHKALKLYCLANDLEIGEAMEKAVDTMLAEARRR